jgi:uncharacterized protein DUF6640
MTRRRVSVALFTFISIFLAVSAYAADWNETHIYNPRWPPHAKFHDAQTMLLGTLLAGMTLFFTWRRRGDPDANLMAAAMAAAAYWVALCLSITFPGTAFLDPEFDDPSRHVLGLPGNLFVAIVSLLVIALAAWLGLTHHAPRRMAQASGLELHEDSWERKDL